MKKYVCMLTALIASALFNSTFAQQASMASIDPGTKYGKALNNISTRAIRDFHHSYTDVYDEQWYPVMYGFIAKFTLNNIKTRVDYDKQGNWLSTTRFLSESQMPREVRRRVKSVYFDDSITLVLEIENKEDKVYIVNLEGQTTWKKVRVSNSELIELEDYNKTP